MFKDEANRQPIPGEPDVLVLQDAALSKRLSKVPLGPAIPDPVFEALSVALGFLMEEDGRFNHHPDTNRG